MVCSDYISDIGIVVVDMKASENMVRIQLKPDQLYEQMFI